MADIGSKNIEDFIIYFNSVPKVNLTNPNVVNIIRASYLDLVGNIVKGQYSTREAHIKYIKLFTAGKMETLINDITNNIKGVKPENIIDIIKSKANLYLNDYQKIEANAIKGKSRSAKFFDDELGKGEANFVYRTQSDSRVRQTHAEMNGTTRKKSDPFWDTHTPPLNYNCRCYLVSTDNKVTGKPDIGIKEIKEGREAVKTDWVNEIKEETNPMAYNAAKTDYILPPNHTYIETVSKDFYDKVKNIFDDE